MSDLIDRKSVLDVLKQLSIEHFSLDERFEQYLKAMMDAEDAIRKLSVIRSDIILCKECEHCVEDGPARGPWCIFRNVPIGPHDYCSWAERILDE